MRHICPARRRSGRRALPPILPPRRSATRFPARRKRTMSALPPARRRNKIPPARRSASTGPGHVSAGRTAPDTRQDPAHLTADRLTATLTEPVRYEVRGVPNHTLIEFTPRPRAEKPLPPGKEPARRFAFGTLQVRRFES